MKRNGYLYRKIWVAAYGEIPKDAEGRSYEIHHVNGDRTDNRLENLQCVSIQEHFDIHYAAGEYKACALIAGRMNKPVLKREMSALAKKKMSDAQRLKVLDGTHHLLSGEIQSHANKVRVQQGTHNFLDKDWHSSKNKRLVESGKHCLLKREDGTSIGGESSRERISNGTHHFLDNDHQKKAAAAAKLVCQKPVLRISPCGESIKYDSVKDALHDNPTCTVTLYKKIGTGKPYKGFTWEYSNK